MVNVGRWPPVPWRPSTGRHRWILRKVGSTRGAGRTFETVGFYTGLRVLSNAWNCWTCWFFTTNMTEWSMFNKNRCFSLFFFDCRFCFKPIILELSLNWIWRTYENFVKRWCDQWMFVFFGGTSVGKTSMSKLKQFEHLIFVLVVFLIGISWWFFCECFVGSYFCLHLLSCGGYSRLVGVDG